MTSILFLILYYIYRVNNISCEINILVSLNIYLYNFGLNENLNQDSLNGARFTSISFKALTDTILTVTLIIIILIIVIIYISIFLLRCVCTSFVDIYIYIDILHICDSISEVLVTGRKKCFRRGWLRCFLAFVKETSQREHIYIFLISKRNEQFVVRSIRPVLI